MSTEPPQERDYRKPCTLCNTPRDVLVRCQIDESGIWHFVCPGACWKSVSGGVIDGDRKEEHEYYRYGGMVCVSIPVAIACTDNDQWKNKHEAVSAKKPKKKKTSRRNEATGTAQSTAESSLAEDSSANDEPLSSHPAIAAEAASNWQSDGRQYTRNDRVQWNDQIWICRKSHISDEKWDPGRAYSLWKTAT